MKKLILLVLLINIALLSQSQGVYKYAVEFNDKNNTPFSLDEPSDFLSQRAIDRRIKFNIGYDETDLPIDPQYIANVLAATSDAKLIIQVKWMNSIIISLSDTNNIELINDLPAVANTKLVFSHLWKKSKGAKFQSKFTSNEPLTNEYFKGTQEYDSAFYGGAWVQTHQMNVEKMHQQGYKGQGMVIAVLDAGFISADTLRIFQSLRDNNQILGTKNFVVPEMTVFAESTHGTSVLSTMGGYWEGTLVGTAPDADYWLIRTEDTRSTETLTEEYNWVAGAAFADSVGADVLNTSLGYTTFDDPSQDHSWADLDGNKTVITRGANMAYYKGMLPVNSAGNSGNKPWRYIGAPADGTEVFSIGAVNGDGELASFSSIGFPWSDDVKPNVVARGAGTYVASATSNTVGGSNGTSFSSPVMAGAIASLWSADPSVAPHWIKRAIEKSASQYMQPDTLLGYGIPNFQDALNILGVNQIQLGENFLSVSPNPMESIAYLTLNTLEQSSFNMNIYDIQGRLIESEELVYTGSKMPINISRLHSGIFILEVIMDSQTYRLKINKL